MPWSDHYVILDTLSNKYYGWFFHSITSAEIVAATESFAWRAGWHAYDALDERYEG